MERQLLIKKIQLLPTDLQKEVVDFIEFLLQKKEKSKADPPKQKINFDWEGGLAELKDEYSAVELQHKIKEYR